MPLREKHLLACTDPTAASSRLLLQHRKAVSENGYYHAFIRTLPPPQNLQAQDTGPLRGLSFAVKDTFAVAGYERTLGCAIHSGPAARSALLVELLQERGALLFGTTNLDELCLTHNGVNLRYGEIVNPLDPERSVLGSSGGSATAVAHGQVDFALGTDFGGSVRLPAAACGLYGFKPSPSLLPRDGIWLFSELLDTPGILTRAADDARFLMTALGAIAPNATSRISKLCIPMADAFEQFPEDCHTQFLEFVELLRRSRAIAEIPLPLTFEQILSARKTLAALAVARVLETADLQMELSDTAKAIILYAHTLPSDAEAHALAASTAAKSFLSELHASGAALLTPALSASVPTRAAMKAGKEPPLPLNTFLVLANLAEAPALVAPTPLFEERLPYAVQIIGSCGHDQDLLLAGGLLSTW
jgi:amidase